jgi:hypothetical protein
MSACVIQRGFLSIEKLYHLHNNGCSLERRAAMRVKTSVKAGPIIRNGGTT